MPRLFFLLLSTLLLSACHKSEEPAPTPEGEWQVQSQTHYLYNLDGTLARKDGPVSLAGLYRVDFMADTVFLVYIGGPLPPTRKLGQYYPYTRQGNRLAVAPPNAAESLETTDLRAHSMTLLLHEYPSPLITGYVELKLTR